MVCLQARHINCTCVALELKTEAEIIIPLTLTILLYDRNPNVLLRSHWLLEYKIN